MQLLASGMLHTTVRHWTSEEVLRSFVVTYHT